MAKVQRREFQNAVQKADTFWLQEEVEEEYLFANKITRTSNETKVYAEGGLVATRRANAHQRYNTVR